MLFGGGRVEIERPLYEAYVYLGFGDGAQQRFLLIYAYAQCDQSTIIGRN